MKIRISNDTLAIYADTYRREYNPDKEIVDEVEFNEGLRSIGADSFNGQNLKVVEMPGSVMMIGNGAFMDNDIESITISSLVKFIGARTFNNNQLESLLLPDNIRTIGDYAFNNNKIEELHLGKVERLGQYAFNDNKIRELILPDTLEEIGSYAFTGNQIENVVRIPDSLKSIGSFAFNNDVKLDIGGHIIPASFICDRNIPYGRISSTVKLSTLREYLDKYPNANLTPAFVSLLYKAKIEHEDIQNILDRYFVAGDLEIELTYDDENIAVKLEELFTEQFRNIPGARKPEYRILESYAIVCTQLGISPEEVVGKFNFNAFRENMIQNRKYSNVENILAMTYLDLNDYNKCLSNGTITNVVKTLMEYTKSDEQQKESLMTAALWMIDHPTANDTLINMVKAHALDYHIERNDSAETIYAKQAQYASSEEIRKIEARYPNFKFTDCTFDLKFSDTTYRDSNRRRTFHMCILRPGDTRMAQIGYDTHCCQHLGGAGETAMMHGLLNPKGGFWIMEDANTHAILGQAEIWEDTRGRLVFDNIEFANDGDISMYYNPIGQWLMESGYENAIMGTGYNELARGMSGLTNCSPVIPWVTFEELYRLDKNHVFSDMAQAQRFVEEFNTKIGNIPIVPLNSQNQRIIRDRFPVGDTYYGVVYTDADEHCKVLKEDGRVKECLLNDTQKAAQREKFSRPNQVITNITQSEPENENVLNR